MLRSKFERVISCLESGQKIKIGENRYAFSDKGELGVIMTRVSNGVETEELFLVDFSFNDFRKMVERMPEENIALIIMEKLLNS